MIQRLFLLETDTTDPYHNLALEEYLFNTAEPGDCILYLWQNRHTVVIGSNQSPWLECRTALLEGDGGRLARRLSGGGAVYHDMGNLNFTFLVHSEDYDLRRQLSVITTACRQLGIPAECSGRNDILADGRKFSGNGFYQHQDRRYHHGTILVDADMEKMGKYLSPSPAKLQARGVPSVRSRVINLRELCPGLTIQGMKDALGDAFSRVYQLPTERIFPADLSEKHIAVLEERYRSWEWLYGRPLAFTFQCAGKYPWGEITIQLAAESGTVTAAAVYTDAMDPSFAAPLEQALAGCPFHVPQLYQAVERAPISQEVRRDVCTLLAEQNL